MHVVLGVWDRTELHLLDRATDRNSSDLNLLLCDVCGSLGSMILFWAGTAVVAIRKRHDTLYGAPSLVLGEYRHPYSPSAEVLIHADINTRSDCIQRPYSSRESTVTYESCL